MSKIFLLEDDHVLTKEISQFLIRNNYICDCANDGLMAETLFQLKKYDLAILDINVPGKSGIEVCKSLRKNNPKLSILMLTAFSELDDKLKAFNNGADDYLAKPFHFEELLVRIKSLLRRNNPQQEKSEIISIDDLRIDGIEMKVCRNGIEINLSPKEFKLLYVLAKANGRVLSKNQIADELWDYHIETTQNTIEVYINFLRKKIDKNHDVKLIHTKVGYGYYIKKEE